MRSVRFSRKFQASFTIFRCSPERAPVEAVYSAVVRLSSACLASTSARALLYNSIHFSAANQNVSLLMPQSSWLYSASFVFFFCTKVPHIALLFISVPSLVSPIREFSLAFIAGIIREIQSSFHWSSQLFQFVAIRRIFFSPAYGVGLEEKDYGSLGLCPLLGGVSRRGCYCTSRNQAPRPDSGCVYFREYISCRIYLENMQGRPSTTSCGTRIITATPQELEVALLSYIPAHLAPNAETEILRE